MVNQTRFFMTERAKIDENIANGTINAHDLVLTSDTHELIFIDTDNTYFAVTTTDAGLNELVDSVRAEIEELREEAKNSLVTGVKGSNETTYRKGDVNIGTDDIGLGRVENFTQVRGLFSGTTEGHVVTWGRNGYIVADGGHTLEADVPEDAVFTDTTYGNATETAAGLMSAADKVKLDNLDNVTPVTYDIATETSDGLMSAADKTKLDNLENGEIYTDFVGYSSATGGQHGLVPAPTSASGLLTSTGSWLRPRLRSYKTQTPNGAVNGQQIVLELLDANNNAVFWSVPLDLANSDSGSGDLVPATSTMPGIMSSSDKIKLDGIETGAQKNVVYENATTEAAGLMSAEDKTKLDSIGDTGGGSTSPLEVTTWAALVAKRDAGTLTPGMQYRITDYVCTTTQDESRAVSHPFDIILTADDAGTLNENARAVKKDGDTYYQYADLSAWELKYCLDNDADRFKWADTENGKGVIYWLKDDHNNECPYDFKQIQFKRYPITTCTVSSLVGEYTALQHGGAITGVDEQNPVWCYTFSYDPEETGVMSDASVMEFTQDNEANVSENIIKNFYDFNDNVAHLNDIVLIGNNNYSNTFGNRCQNNTFGDICRNNTFGNDCQNNTFGNGCRNNTFGNGCRNNTFGIDCRNNTFGNNCRNNTFGNDCQNNTFGIDCQNNTFGNNCRNNTFGNDCYYIDVSAGTPSQIKQYYHVLDGVQGTNSSHISITGTNGNNFVTYVGKNSSGVLKTWVPADLVQ